MRYSKHSFEAVSSQWRKRGKGVTILSISLGINSASLTTNIFLAIIFTILFGCCYFVSYFVFQTNKQHNSLHVLWFMLYIGTIYFILLDLYWCNWACTVVTLVEWDWRKSRCFRSWWFSSMMRRSLSCPDTEVAQVKSSLLVGLTSQTKPLFFASLMGAITFTFLVLLEVYQNARVK